MHVTDIETHFGSRAKACQFLGMSEWAGYKWNKVVPLRVAAALEHYTDGALRVNWRCYRKDGMVHGRYKR